MSESQTQESTFSKPDIPPEKKKEEKSDITDDINVSSSTANKKEKGIMSNGDDDNNSSSNPPPPASTTTDDAAVDAPASTTTQPPPAPTHPTPEPTQLPANPPEVDPTDPLTTPPNDDTDTLLSSTFNQDGGCLAVGTAAGFRICNVHPYQETFRRVFRGDGGADGDGAGGGNDAAAGGGGGGGGGIGSVTMLFRCNLLALVGGGPSPHYPPNKVLIWDDHLGRCIGELSFRQRVLAVRLRRDRIAVALRDRVYVYNFSDLGLLDKIHTCDNSGGLLCISTEVGGGGGGGNGSGGAGGGGGGHGMVLACPSVTGGQVRVELYGMRKTVLIDAHESSLAAMALTSDGTLLATASEKGTVIRLFDARRHYSSSSGGGGGDNNDDKGGGGGAPLREFRRGVERAKISSLTFSLDRCWLGCASDRGTVHVFRINLGGNDNHSNTNTNTDGSDNNTDNSKKKKKSSSFKLIPKVLTSPKKLLLGRTEINSYAQVRGVPHPHSCAFVPDRPRTLAVAGTDEFDNGVLLLAEFGPEINMMTAEAGGSGAVGNEGPRSGSGGGGGGEARRVSYHRFFKRGGAAEAAVAAVGGGAAGGRARSRGSSLGSAERDNTDNNTGQEQRVYIDDDGEKRHPTTTEEVDDIANGMEKIVFDDEEGEDGFVSVETTTTASAVLAAVGKETMDGSRATGGIGATVESSPPRLDKSGRTKTETD